MSSTEAAPSLAQLHDRAVRRLIVAHASRTDEPLVLAVRFREGDATNIHLFEVLEGFPGDDDEPLFRTEFGPSAELVIAGKLELVLGSAAQLRSAIDRGDPLIEELRAGTVLHASPERGAADLLRSLGSRA
jgi:hypothetical protein